MKLIFCDLTRETIKNLPNYIYRLFCIYMIRFFVTLFR